MTPEIIAGPCVIESEELLDRVARRIVEINRSLGCDIIFKASFDKANRTSLSSYRGVGIDKGLRMLADIRSKWGLRLLTDIHEAWQAALPVYRKIIQHPFVDALARGTLDNERFMFYLRQDSLYLARYSRALTHIASRLADKDHTAAFIRFASDGTAVEKALHESFLQGSVPDQKEISPACLLYTSLLGSQAAAPV